MEQNLKEAGVHSVFREWSGVGYYLICLVFDVVILALLLISSKDFIGVYRALGLILSAIYIIKIICVIVVKYPFKKYLNLFFLNPAIQVLLIAGPLFVFCKAIFALL